MATGEVAIAVGNTAKKFEATPVANNPKEKVASTVDVNPKKSSEELAKWLTRIFITSCVLGVLLDPLFLYTPLLNQDLKCVRLDNTIKIIALVSRLFTDLFYVGRIIVQVCRFEICSPWIKKHLPQICPFKLMTPLIESFLGLLPEGHETKLSTEIWESSILVDIFAILPLPQLAILIFFPKMRGAGSFAKRIVNILVMGQYVPRVLRIYLSCKKAKKPFKGYTPLWLKALLNLFLYILASHVLGAFCYFFAAQQMISCWKHACRYENGCVATTFHCHEDQTLTNITVLNNFCPIDPPNSTLFDFGIYLNVLQSGALWSTDYPFKFLNSFCWGLRNLSSLGSNLQPSIYIWEIAFVAFICIIGLMLFVYLIGSLQTYVLIGTESVESQRRKNKLDKKTKQKDKEVESWLSRHGIPLSRKPKIMEEIKKELEENSHVDVVTEIRENLPREEIESCNPLSRLRKVPLLEHMEKKVLKEISEKLKPEKYTPGHIIIERDKTLEKMLFIVDGDVTIEKTGCQPEEPGTRKFYGEKLLDSLLWTSSETAKPLNDESVRATNDVQALVLYAKDMARIKITKHKLPMVIRLRKVPLLREMDKGVWVEISKKIQSKEYTPGQIIIEKDEKLEMMLFVVDGNVTIEKTGSRREEPGAGKFYGEKLLDSLLWTSSEDAKPLNDESVRAINHVQALVLHAKDMASIITKHKLHFDYLLMEIRLRKAWMIMLRKVEIFQKMEEQVLEAISECLKPMNYNVAKDHILQENKPLEMMFFVNRGVVLIDSAMDVNFKKTCEVGSFYGEELVHWVTTWVNKSFPAKLPLSPGSALCSESGGSVEILALTADDLKSVVSKFRSKFSTETTLPTDSDQPRDPLTILKNVKALKTIDEEVLKEICGHLELITYEDAYIIQKDKPLEMMFFIVSGVVSVTDGSSKNYLNEGGLCPNHRAVDLIEHWLQSKSTSVPAELPTSPYSIWAIGEVKVQVLKADDLAKVQPRIGS